MSHYLKEQGYGGVSIYVTERLKKDIDFFVGMEKMSKLEFIDFVLSDYLSVRSEDPARYFGARSSGTRLVWWIKPEVFSELQRISKEDGVSLRSICTTALVDFFGSLKDVVKWS